MQNSFYLLIKKIADDTIIFKIRGVWFMFKIITADEAANLIKDGDCIGINSFLALANPSELHNGIMRRFKDKGHPSNLELFCAAGFGGWDENLFADQYVKVGAVKKITASHYNSMPAVMQKILDNKIEAYCMPLGILSHSIRAAAARHDYYFSKIGLNIFVDPRLDGPALNECSKEMPVKLIDILGEEYLSYKTPKIDVALIKGTAADPNGNISFENENVTVDAFSLAQATKNNGGIVIVQVEKVSHVFSRPRNVIVPGILVDAVVVCDKVPNIQKYNPVLSGDIHVPPTQMDYWMSKLNPSGKRSKESEDKTADIIGRRAAKELKPGNIVNIGIGIPELVGKYASELGILKNITLTVEAGGIGGLPAPGVAFGSTIGSDMICDMAMQFDFYDGGGLDICFMGAIEADKYGNVNAHRVGKKFPGIGGFANITAKTKNVVFCLSFTAKGLIAKEKNGKINIETEGTIKKFKSKIDGISFSAKNALRNNQNVLYVTERCVFKLTDKGLKLIEIYDGIDKQKQVLDMLDFKPIE